MSIEIMQNCVKSSNFSVKKVCDRRYAMVFVHYFSRSLRMYWILPIIKTKTKPTNFIRRWKKWVCLHRISDSLSKNFWNFENIFPTTILSWNMIGILFWSKKGCVCIFITNHKAYLHSYYLEYLNSLSYCKWLTKLRLLHFSV